MRELLVDELRGEHGVRLFDGVGRREVIVLARVDDDSRKALSMRLKCWSTNVRFMLMSRKRMPYIESLSSMSSRSSAAVVAISGMHSPLAYW